jgi:hypothetical protein
MPDGMRTDRPCRRRCVACGATVNEPSPLECRRPVPSGRVLRLRERHNREAGVTKLVISYSAVTGAAETISGR